MHGLKFPNLRRPIPLGLGIRAEVVSALFELACRYGRQERVFDEMLTCQGWIAVMGWQVGLASLCFIVGTVIQGLIVLDNLDTYQFERWHGTLLVMAIVGFCIIFNSFLAGKLPFVESMVLIIHVLGFIGVLIPLWVLAPKSSASSVF